MVHFVGDRLASAIRKHKLVEHDPELTNEFLRVGEQMDLVAGEVVYQEGDVARGIFLVLLGSIQLTQHGNTLQLLQPGEDFGTWPYLFSDPRYKVTAAATADALLFHIDDQAFQQVTNRFPRIWKHIARIQVERLQHQDRLLLPKNPRVKLFIGSSTEQIESARKLANYLVCNEDALEVLVWDSLFGNLEYPLEALTRMLGDSDFAALIWGGEDTTHSRSSVEASPRDNVIFEAGLSIGRLGRSRTFILVPEDATSRLKIPSDLAQATFMKFSDAAMSHAGERIRTIIRAAGPRTRLRDVELTASR
jgi:CRP/FNR family transcriptional regulator, cyclic AMP receptor protein